MALAESPELSEFSGEVRDSGEGRWTIATAIEEAHAAPRRVGHAAGGRGNG